MVPPRSFGHPMQILDSVARRARLAARRAEKLDQVVRGQDSKTDGHGVPGTHTRCGAVLSFAEQESFSGGLSRIDAVAARRTDVCQLPILQKISHRDRTGDRLERVK